MAPELREVEADEEAVTQGMRPAGRHQARVIERGQREKASADQACQAEAVGGHAIVGKCNDFDPISRDTGFFRSPYGEGQPEDP